MALNFENVALSDSPSSHYRRYDPDRGSNWMEQLANEYVSLRSECILPLDNISLDGIEVLNIEGLRSRLEKATIPLRGRGNFDIIRSDFGETLGYSLLEQEYQTMFGYKALRDRETIQLPGRGIDGVGIEDHDPLTLVLCEVKVSDEDASPPQVVDRSRDSLRFQHRGHISDRKLTANKIWNLSRHITNRRIQDLHFAAALRLEHGDWDELRIVATCILIRPGTKYSEADYGSFRSNPEDFWPAVIRFLVFCIPENNVNDFIDNWYSLVLNRINRNG